MGSGLDILADTVSTDGPPDFGDKCEPATLGAQRAVPMTWAVHGVVPAQGIIILAGPPKMARKTLLGLHLSLCMATGRPFLGRYEVSRCEVFYAAIEDGVERTRRRLYEFGAHLWPSGLDQNMLQVGYGLGAYAHANWLLDRKVPALIVVDTLAQVLASSGVDENDMAAVTNWMRPLHERAHAAHAIVLIIHHFRKAGDVMRGSTAINAGVDGWLTSTPVSGGVLLNWLNIRDVSPLDHSEVVAKFRRDGANGQSLTVVEAGDTPEQEAKAEHIRDGVREAVCAVGQSKPVGYRTIASAMRDAGKRISYDRLKNTLTAMKDEGEVTWTAGAKGGGGWVVTAKLVEMMTRRVENG